LVGPPLSAEETAQVVSLGLSEHVVLFSNVSSEHLEAFYGLAEALIFPSWEEGFGWPIAEAQACGCPVFTSNREPMTEVGGESALYFDPADPVGAAGIIAAAWPTRAARRGQGFEEARRWQPKVMFSAYEALYQNSRVGKSGLFAP
jgi:glycosyltransferase involved in cell wall biosynthesis